MIRLAPAAAALGIVCMAGIATAAPRVSVDTVYYDVRGADARQLVDYMLRHGPGGPSGRALGTTSAVLRHDGDFSGEAKCHLQNYRVELELTIRLPRLANGQALSGSLRRQWNGFAEHVRQHENRHKAIYETCARRIEQRVRALNGTVSCGVLQTRMRRVFDEENARCDAEHVAFDTKEASRIVSLPLIARASQRSSQSAVTQSRESGAGVSAARVSRQNGLSVEDLK